MVSAAPVMSPVEAKRSDRMIEKKAQVDRMNWRKVVFVIILVVDCYVIVTVAQPLR